MAETTRRTAAESDAPLLAAFMTSMAVAAGAEAAYTDDEVRAWFTSGLIRDPAADTRLVLTGDGQLAGAALLVAPPAGGRRVDAFGGVLSAWQGQGLGRELFGWQVERARQMWTSFAAESPAESAAWDMDADAFTTEKRTLLLFERYGLSPVRYWFQMARPLGSLPVTPVAVPPGLRVVAFTPDLAEALYAAHVEAFADHYDYQPRDFESWAEREIRRADFLPGLSRIALDGDEVAAYVLTEARPDRRVVLELVGTRPAWRHRGAASALVAQVLAAAAADGQERARLAVDSQSPTGAVSIYRRAGFEVASSWASYRRTLT